MPKFRYKAVLTTGKVVTGTIDDESREKVMIRLKNNGLQPVSVQQSRMLSAISQQKAKKNRGLSSSAAVSRYSKA